MKISRRGNHEFNNGERRDYHKNRTNSEVIDGILARIESGDVFTAREGDGVILEEMREKGYIVVRGEKEGRMLFQKNDRLPLVYGDDIDLTVKVMTYDQARLYRRQLDTVVAQSLADLGHAEVTTHPDGAVSVSIRNELSEKQVDEVREDVNATMGYQASAVA